MTEETKGFLGLIRRAGKMEIGDMAAAGALQGHKARLIVLASDAGTNIVHKMEQLTEKSNVPLAALPLDKEGFSRCIGRDNVAVAAVTDLGFSASLMERLAREHPEQPQYEASFQQLSRKRERGPKKQADTRRK